MRFRLKAVVVPLAATAILVGTAGIAFAAAPPYEPAAGSIGGLIFYNSSGAQVTTGNLADDPFAAYVQATTPGRPGDDKATLFGFLPKNGQSPGQWSGEALTASPVYPNAGAPGQLGTTSLPVLTGTSGDLTLEDLIQSFPNTATDSYAGLYQLRLETSGPGQSANTAAYDSADIVISGSTWTEVYSADASPTATTTTLGTPSPASPVTVGSFGGTQSVNLSATVTPTSAVGTVQFLDGATPVGSPVAVASGAASSTATLAVGTHSLSATFIPENAGTTNPVTDPTPDFTTSTSSATSYEVDNPAAGSTSTLLSVNTGAGAALSPVTFTATVAPAAAAGTISLVDVFTPTSGPASTTTLTTTAAGAGTFTYTTSALGTGSHSVTATFNPTAPAQYATSSSAAQAFALTAPLYAPAVGNITASIPAGTLLITTPYTPTAPLNLGPLTLNSTGTEFTGTVAFGVAGSGSSTSTDGIAVTDNRAGDLPWTASGLASSLTGSPSGSINGENVGLTNVSPDFITGNALDAASLTSGNLTLFENPAANGVSPADTGSAGLGGTAAHQIAHANQGEGTVGFDGLITLIAPTSTPAGAYAGTVTFTIIGS